MNDTIEEDGFIHCGRRITKKEIVEIQEMVSLFPKLSLSELSDTVSENLDWHTQSGQTKTDACLALLERLERFGLVTLPEKREAPKGKKRKRMRYISPDLPEIPIEGGLGELGGVELELAWDGEKKDLFEGCIHQYHYLGYHKPFGCYIRYLIQCGEGLLGCALFAGPARKIAKRDDWIGWSRRQRYLNQGYVVNNSRFLIFPWVRVKNLASHVLGKIGRRIARDWEDRWNYSPVLMETFVDPEHYEGTCYKAANWKDLGMTSGVGLARKGKNYESTPKKIFVKELRKDFRKVLCKRESARKNAPEQNRSGSREKGT